MQTILRLHGLEVRFVQHEVSHQKTKYEKTFYETSPRSKASPFDDLIEEGQYRKGFPHAWPLQAWQGA